MNIQPRIEKRNKQSYSAIKSNLKREEMPQLLPPLIPEFFQWLSENNIDPGGAPFFNYLKMENELEIEVGIPTKFQVQGDGHVEPGVFPEGKYAVATYVGTYKNLFAVNGAIEKWKDENNLKFKSPKVEFYPTDPAEEPNPENWETIIINRIDD